MLNTATLSQMKKDSVGEYGM